MRKQEAAEMANRENALKNKAEEVADLEKKMNNAAAELDKAKADLENAKSNLELADDKDGKKAEDARTKKAEARGRAKIHESERDRLQRKFERAVEAEKRMIKALAGATSTDAPANEDGGPEIPCFREDLINDPLTGLDKPPKFNRYNPYEV